MTTEIRIESPNGKAPVYAKFDGQCQPQPAYIHIGENGSIYADYDGSVGSGVPANVWNKRDSRISIRQTTSGKALRELFADEAFLGLVRRYYDGFDTEWNGSNNVGRLTEDAREALSEIERTAEGLDCINVFDASDWVDYATREEMAQHGGYEGYAKYLDGLTDADQLVEGGVSAIEDALRDKFADDEDEE